MAQDVIQRLMYSFSVLEQAIEGARSNLASRTEVPTEVLERIESYNGLLATQKKVAGEIMNLLEESNWEAVAQKIQVINGLLEMIRQDAQEIVRALKDEEELDGEDPSIPVC